MRILLLFLFVCATILQLRAQDLSFEVKENIVYSPNRDAYSLEKCKLDIYIPKGEKDFVTFIWFHGGGLTSGEKQIPTYLKNKGIAVVGAGYRLSPNVKVEDIIHDAADVVKWTYDNIGAMGGNKNKIVVGGISAGAYLALMLGLDKSYLQDRAIDADSLLGILSCSAQTITHFTARKEMGIEELQPLIDKLAPLYWVRKEAPKILLLTGGRELELMGRYEENAYLYRMLKLVNHQEVELLELEGYGHNMEYPAYPLLIKKIKEWSK